MALQLNFRRNSVVLGNINLQQLKEGHSSSQQLRAAYSSLQQLIAAHSSSQQLVAAHTQQLIAAQSSSWQLMAAHGSSWQLMVAHGNSARVFRLKVFSVLFTYVTKFNVNNLTDQKNTLLQTFVPNCLKKAKRIRSNNNNDNKFKSQKRHARA